MKTVVGLDIPTQSTTVNLRFVYNVGDGPPLQEGERLEFSHSDNDELVMMITLVARHHKAGERYILADAQTDDRWNIQDVITILQASPFVGDEMSVDGAVIPT